MARSGLRKVSPISGALPPGRNNAAVAGNLAKRWALVAVWEWNVSSTTKPCSASFWAGASSSFRLRLPSLPAALCHSAGVPGTPTDRPELTTVAKSSGVPSSFWKTVG